MININELRNSIDEIDDQLVELLERRMKIVLQVAEFKKNNSVNVKDRSREDEIVKRVVGQLKNKDFKDGMTEMMDSIFRVSRKMQRDITAKNTVRISTLSEERVGYQGVAGSYSEEALISYFGENTKRDNYETFDDVFKALDLGEVQYAVLPIENSSTGAIKEVYDLLVRYGFYITGEHLLRVHHNLLCVKGAKIEDLEEVYSHIQGIEQCSGFLDEHPSWKRTPYFNTARSAKFVSETGKNTIAAVGSKRAAEIYNLSVLKENIQDNVSNTTRFVVLSRDIETTPSSNKMSLVFTTPHTSGALYSALSRFADQNVNMIKIESRPIKDKPWEYFFFIDIEGHIEDENVIEAIKNIETESRYFKILGNYIKQNGVG